MTKDPNKFVDLICGICGKNFKRVKSQMFYKNHFCGKECKLKFCTNLIRRTAIANVGKKHHQWKGVNVGYRAIHYWVGRQMVKPKFCQTCSSPERKVIKSNIHWANISGEYKRDIRDWIALCAGCHKRFDNRRKKHA